MNVIIMITNLDHVRARVINKRLLSIAPSLLAVHREKQQQSTI